MPGPKSIGAEDGGEIVSGAETSISAEVAIQAKNSVAGRSNSASNQPKVKFAAPAGR